MIQDNNPVIIAANVANNTVVIDANVGDNAAVIVGNDNDAGYIADDGNDGNDGNDDDAVLFGDAIQEQSVIH